MTNISQSKFIQFKQICQRNPTALLEVVQREGSPELKQSQFMNKLSNNVKANRWMGIFESMINPSILIYLGTIFLHRNRSYALSSGTIFRSMCLKYIPGMGIYYYLRRREISVDVSKMRRQFSEVEDELQILIVKYKLNI